MKIDIVPFEDISKDTINSVANALEKIYDCETRILESRPFPDDAHDPSRNQYESGELLDTVSEISNSCKAIGVTEKDLFYHNRNYIFGLAYLNGVGSIISTHRLQIVPDGGISNKPEDEIATDRIRKEAVHEIGHTLGLNHCDNSRCVMNFSPTVREVDIKEETLCGSCSREVN